MLSQCRYLKFKDRIYLLKDGHLIVLEYSSCSPVVHVSYPRASQVSLVRYLCS